MTTTTTTEWPSSSRIDEEFKAAVNRPSDINEHLVYLRNFCKDRGVESITEMGIRTGVSTRAFLASRPITYVGIDVQQPPAAVYDLVSEVCGQNGKIVIADSRSVSIEPTELLFIDTQHNGDQLYDELTLHHKKVYRWIVMHDTVTFGFRDEVKQVNPRYVGLVPAIDAFIEEHKEWRRAVTFDHNNGLTVLQRIV